MGRSDRFPPSLLFGALSARTCPNRGGACFPIWTRLLTLYRRRAISCQFRADFDEFTPIPIFRARKQLEVFAVLAGQSYSKPREQWRVLG